MRLRQPRVAVARIACGTQRTDRVSESEQRRRSMQERCWIVRQQLLHGRKDPYGIGVTTGALQSDAETELCLWIVRLERNGAGK